LVGLARHPGISISALYLLLYIPFNLFISLAIRNVLLHSFERNRFRELFAILLIGIGVLPQLLIRTGLGHRMKPYFLAASQGTGTPWREIGVLSSGSFSMLALSLILLWILASYVFARWQFEKMLISEEQFRPESGSASPARKARPNPLQNLLDFPTRLFSDPMAALMQKEFQSLIRMPRFRVILGMACVFGVIVFVPIALQSGSGGRNTFLHTNFLPVVNLYGLLLLSDVLLMNVFGFDRQAAQIYFVTPVPFETVLKAKNLTAIVFIALQSVAVLILASLIRVSITPVSVASACVATAVVGIFFLSVGNISSIAMPRPIDPRQTFRKQSGGKMQLWLMLASLGMFLLMGFAVLADYALQSKWALFGVLFVEMVIGVIVYRLATQSAVERGLRDGERMLEALSKGAAPVALGM
jgi:ABC-2 type transport system permease protein